MNKNFQKYLNIINELKIPKGGLAFNKKIVKLTKRFYLAEYLYHDHAFGVLSLKRPSKRHRKVQTVTVSGILKQFPHILLPTFNWTVKGAKKNNLTVTNATIDQFTRKIKIGGNYIEDTSWYDFIRKKVGLKDKVESNDIAKYSTISNLTPQMREELKRKLRAEFESDIERRKKQADEDAEKLQEEFKELGDKIFKLKHTNYPPYNVIDKVIKTRDKEIENKNKAIANKDKEAIKKAEMAIKKAEAQISLIDDEREKLQKEQDEVRKKIDKIYKNYNDLNQEFLEKMYELDNEIKALTHDEKDVEPIIQLSVLMSNKNDPTFEIIPDWDGRTKAEYETDINLGSSASIGEVYMTKTVYDALLAELNKKRNSLN